MPRSPPTAPSGSRRWACGTLADLCCGIGGDAIALARAGIRVLAVDRDPLACAAARANAEALGLAELIEVRCADVTEVDTAGYDAVFVDPAPAQQAGGAGSSTPRRTRRRCRGPSRRPARHRSRR